MTEITHDDSNHTRETTGLERHLEVPFPESGEKSKEEVYTELKPVTRDGAWHAVSVAAGESYLAPLGVFLNATTMQIGLLGSVPLFIGSLFQLLGLGAVGRCTQRKPLVAKAVLVQACCWIPIAFLAFTADLWWSPWALILIAAIYFAAGSFPGPAWNSLVGDLIPERFRSEYLGMRSAFLSAVTFGSLALAGLLLEAGKFYEQQALAFCALFAISFAARAMSGVWLNRYDDPPYEKSGASSFGLRQFLSRAEDSNFVRYVLFVSMFNFASSIAAPFYALYVIRDLHFSYFEFMVAESLFLLFQTFTLPQWGRAMQSFGAKKVLTVCACGVAINPFMMMFSPNVTAMAIVKVVLGITWSGYVLSTTTFLFDAVTPAQRSRCVAYQGTINALLVFAGAQVGSVIAYGIPEGTQLAASFMPTQSPLIVVLFISGIVRMSMLPFLTAFKEVRKVEAVSHRDLVIRHSPLRPLTASLLSAIPRKRRTESSLPDEHGDEV